MVLQELIVNEEFNLYVEELRAVPVSGDLLALCSANVVVFAEKMLGFKLYSWQVHFLSKLQDSSEGRGKNITVAITSRQIGKSQSVAIFALWASLFNKKPATASWVTNVLICSRSDDQAKKLLRDVRRTYRMGDRFLRDAYKDADGNSLFGYYDSNAGKFIGFIESLLSKDDPNNSKMISFMPCEPKLHGEFLMRDSKGSSSIICLPPTAGVLGYTFSIGFIDEAGHEDIPDSFWYDELFPTGDSTNAMWVFTSTPWKPDGFFYEYVDPFDE